LATSFFDLVQKSGQSEGPTRYHRLYCGWQLLEMTARREITSLSEAGLLNECSKGSKTFIAQHAAPAFDSFDTRLRETYVRRPEEILFVLLQCVYDGNNVLIRVFYSGARVLIFECPPP